MKNAFKNILTISAFSLAQLATDVLADTAPHTSENPTISTQPPPQAIMQPYDTRDLTEQHHFSNHVLAKYYFNSAGCCGLKWDKDSLVIYKDGKVFVSKKQFGIEFVLQLSQPSILKIQRVLKRIPTETAITVTKLDDVKGLPLSYIYAVRNHEDKVIVLVNKNKKKTFFSKLEDHRAEAIVSELYEMWQYGHRLMMNWSFLAPEPL